MSADTHATAASDKDARLTEALARFKLAADAEAPQRTREVEDLKFVDFDEQWPSDVKAARDGFQPGGGLPPVPARPCLTINKLRQPVIQTSNEARQARLSLNFAPKGNGASQDTAEVFEDIARAIQVDSRAHLARQWAYDRAIKCGRGYYRILTDYANDGDFDQDIIYARILNQSSVYMDPAATEPDGSDAEWAFIIEDVPHARYKRQFPTGKIASADPGELEGIGDEQPDWVKSAGDTKDGWVIRVAEYFYVEYTRQTVFAFAFPDGTEKALAEDDPLVEQGTPVLDDKGQPISREVQKRSVKWCKLNAVEVLESRDWPGRYIPIVPVIADEANVNGERRWTGLVRPSMDAQRSYNYMRSAQVESVGLAPKAPWVGHAQVFEGYEAWWSQANTRNFTYLPINKVSDGAGGFLPAPTRNVVEPAIQAITLAAHEADSDIKATTGRFDASLGNLNPSERSGRAIQALQKQGEQGSVGYLDNLGGMSMTYEGKILLDLIPIIYSRPGRILAAVGADDQRRAILVGQPFVVEKGQPKPVAPGTPGAKFFDLRAGQYSVAVTIGKSFTTRREEGAAAMGQLAEAAPQLVPAFADLWVGEMDFPGARKISDRLKKVAPPEVQENPDGQELPPKVQQQMQQAQQMIDMLTKELDAKNEIIERELVKEQAETQRQLAKLQADIDTARMDNESKEKVAAMQIERDLLLAQLQQQTAALQAQHQAQQAGEQREHDAAMAGQKHIVDVAKTEAGLLQKTTAQAMSQDHDADMAAQAHQSQAALQAQQADAQRELAVTQAALQPEPQEAG